MILMIIKHTLMHDALKVQDNDDKNNNNKYKKLNFDAVYKQVINTNNDDNNSDDNDIDYNKSGCSCFEILS